MCDRSIIPNVLRLLDIYQFSVPELTGVGKPVGTIRAVDADVGRNAEMDYTVVGGDGLDVFDIITDTKTQEGVLTVKKVDHFRRFFQGVLCVCWSVVHCYVCIAAS